MNLEAVLFGNLCLAVFDFRVVKLFNVAALHAHQMIVVLAFIEFKNSFIRLEMMAYQQSGLFELRQHAVDGCKAGIRALFLQQLVNIFRRQVAHCAAFEQLQYAQSGQRRLEAAGF